MSIIQSNYVAGLENHISNPLEKMKSKGNGSANQSDQTDEADQAAGISLCWISSVVAMSVKKSPNEPGRSSTRTCTRMLKTSKHQHYQEHRISFQRILVSALNAVKHRLLITVHCRVLHPISLPGSSYIDRQVLYEER